MKKQPFQQLIHRIRTITPISLRQKIGPVLALAYYLDRLYLRPNKNRPKILSIEDTVDTLIEKNLSLIRFGDGEITLLDGLDIPFQKRDRELTKRLEEIIKSRHDDLLICIPGMWGDLSIFAPYAYHFIMHHMYRYNHIWKNLLSYDRVYGDTNVTRHYLAYNNKESAGRIFKKIFSLWEGKDVVLIEGSKSRLGVGNDMFDKTNTMKRILCPPENAYSKYREILNEALTIPKDTTILISLGPTAKVLAYDLFLAGYRVLDIGHLDMEYEMFLRKEVKQVKVAHKYFNEINERNPVDCTDERYLSQIIATIH